MTTPEIISKELPPIMLRHIEDGDATPSETEMLKAEFQQAQREAVLRAFDVVRWEADKRIYEGKYNCSEAMLMEFCKVFDQINDELKGVKEPE